VPASVSANALALSQLRSRVLLTRGVTENANHFFSFPVRDTKLTQTTDIVKPTRRDS